MSVSSSSLLAAQTLAPFGRKPPTDNGPRALGLVQVSPKGKKARFIPIAIMMDGKFYDASAYKADPVPMALEFGIVYEAFRTGVSQGTFTITQPGQLNRTWIAEGSWLPAGSVDPHARKKYTTPVIADDPYGPPVLHRRTPKSEPDSASDSGSAAKDASQNKDQSKEEQKPAPAAPSTPASSTPASTAPTAADAPKTAPTETAKASPPPSPQPSAADRSTDEPPRDPNRPRLRRGKPDGSRPDEPYADFNALDAAPGATAVGAGAAAGTKDAAAAPQIVVIPAISDAGGPDPRPYTYDLKPAEEAIYRKQMLDLASSQLHPQASPSAKPAAAASKKSGKAAPKPAAPEFDDVTLRIFDLSNSNEPVLVLSAKVHQPDVSAAGSTAQTHAAQPSATQPSSGKGNSILPKEITLIARTNLEGELQKLFFSQTDALHLDLTPRMELIDAVDADGDGRGELLFRRSFDGGSAYAIYRVTADGLWPLFEGTP
jgi:hypothetical protein